MMMITFENNNFTENMFLRNYLTKVTMKVDCFAYILTFIVHITVFLITLCDVISPEIKVEK